MKKWLNKILLKKEVVDESIHPFDSIEAAKERLLKPVNFYYRGTSFFVPPAKALQRSLDILNVSTHNMLNERELEKNH